MSLLPARFQPEAIPTLGALVRDAIAPKPSDPYASFYTNTSVELPDGTSGFITEKDCRQIKGAAAPSISKPEQSRSEVVAAPPSPISKPEPKFKPGDKVTYKPHINWPDQVRTVKELVWEQSGSRGAWRWVVYYAEPNFSHDGEDALDFLIPPEPKAEDGGWIEKTYLSKQGVPPDALVQFKYRNGQSGGYVQSDQAPTCWRDAVAYRVLA